MSTLWKAVAENLTESPTWIVALCGKKSIASVLSFGSMNFFCGLGRQALVDLLGQRLGAGRKRERHARSHRTAPQVAIGWSTDLPSALGPESAGCGEPDPNHRSGPPRNRLTGRLRPRPSGAPGSSPAGAGSSRSDHSFTVAVRPRTSNSPTSTRSSAGWLSRAAGRVGDVELVAACPWSCPPGARRCSSCRPAPCTPGGARSRRGRTSPGPLLRPMPILKPSCRPSSRSQALKPSRRVEHVARGGQRAVGVVVLRQRRAEDGHDAVAHVGHERAAVVEDRLAHRGQVAVQRRR